MSVVSPLNAEIGRMSFSLTDLAGRLSSGNMFYCLRMFSCEPVVMIFLYLIWKTKHPLLDQEMLSKSRSWALAYAQKYTTPTPESPRP